MRFRLSRCRAMLNKSITSDKNDTSAINKKAEVSTSSLDESINTIEEQVGGCETKESFDHLKNRIEMTRELKIKVIGISVAYGIALDLFNFKIPEIDDVPSFKKFVYSAQTDTLYIYGSDTDFGKWLFKQLSLLLSTGNYTIQSKSQNIDLFKSDENDEQVVDEYVIELHFGDEQIILQNKNHGLKTITL